MVKRTGWVAGMALGMSGVALAGSGASDHPVTLHVDGAGSARQLAVVAKSDRAIRGRYELEVAGGSGNRSRSAGTVRLAPGGEAVLARVSVGGDLTALLTVTLDDGRTYAIRYP